MGIRECVSLPLKPPQVHKPNHKSNKSAEQEQEGLGIMTAKSPNRVWSCLDEKSEETIKNRF